MADQKQPQKQPSSKAPAGAVGVLVLAAMIATALVPDEGGRRLKPYKDSAGIWTACLGVIGAEVTRRGIAGEKFTDAECESMESNYIVPMVKTMSKCLGPEVMNETRPGEFVAYGRDSYNTGVGAFCKSPMAAKLKQGDHKGACEAIVNWHTWTITIGNRKPKGAGKLVNRIVNGKVWPTWYQDCRDPVNRCRGLAIRRESESRMCLTALED